MNTSTGFKPTLVAFDLDETLVRSKQPLSLEMGVLVKKLLDQMKVAVMAGAGYRQFQHQFLPYLPPDTNLQNLYLFPTNAAQCYTYQLDQWQLVYDNSLRKEEKEKIFMALQEAAVEVGFTNEKQLWGERIEDREGQITFSALGQQAPLMAKLDWDPTGEKRRRLRDAAAKRLSDFQVMTGGATSVDITRRGISKAFGVRKLVELTGIPISEMLYVGDALQPGGNDAVVLETGIRTQQVKGPYETARVIDSLLA